jgi:hypothetical protein
MLQSHETVSTGSQRPFNPHKEFISIRYKVGQTFSDGYMQKGEERSLRVFPFNYIYDSDHEYVHRLNDWEFETKLQQRIIIHQSR